MTIEKGELAKKKKVKMKFIDLDHAWNEPIALSLGCWLMLARRFCVYNAGLFSVWNAWIMYHTNSIR